jgi:UDP-N-acetylmuramyl pentapeptide synthase
MFQKILKFLTQRLLRKLGIGWGKVPVILVTGNIGKSSQTLLLNQVFQGGNWNVISGTRPEKGLNSLAGIAMSILNIDFNMEGKGKVRKIMIATSFLLRIVLSLIIPPKLPNQSILIYEVGYDHQGESRWFKELFEAVDYLVTTNFGWEHNAGFNDVFDVAEYDRVKQFLPADLQREFESPSIDETLKNIALEQLTLMHIVKDYILPHSLMTVENKFYDNTNLITCSNFTTLGGDNPRYLLPDTFVKVLEIGKLIGKKFNINDDNILKTLSSFSLPNGRFNRFFGVNNSVIIDSSYNSDPASLASFIKNVENQILYYKDIEVREKLGMVIEPKHTLIFGEMRELGDSAVREHAIILDKLSSLTETYADNIQDIILIGNEWQKLNTDDIKKSDSEIGLNWIRYNNINWKVFYSAGKIKNYLKTDEIRANDYYWVKGSQNTIFLEIVVADLVKDIDTDKNFLCRRGIAWDKVREKYA